MMTTTHPDLFSLPTADEIAALAAKVEAARKSPDAEYRGGNCPECHAGVSGFVIDGEWVCIHVARHQPRPEVGMGATIVLYTDTIPAVVTKVTRMTVTVQRVEVDKATETDDGAVYPVVTAYGDLSKPIGKPEAYRWNVKHQRAYTGGAGRGSVYVRIGKSYSRTDYKF